MEMRNLIFAGLAAALAVSLAACQEPVLSSGDQNAADAAAFMEANAGEEGVETTTSGLQYKVVRKGSGDEPPPAPTDEVKVHYEGKLATTGEVFDSSYENGVPISFPLNQVIPGWTEGLQLMQPGDEFIFYIPPELGYGAQDRSPAIPPNSALIFRVELIDVLRTFSRG
jgi:FKBP-type peptidyl-prolyl cis-trans isomerase